MRPLKKYHRSCRPKGIDAAQAAPYHEILRHNGEEQIILQSIAALPVYTNKTFEELRLERYLADNKGEMNRNPMPCHHNNKYEKWGGSDINNFLEVNLGSKRIISRRSIVGGTGIYTKKTPYIS